MKKIYIAGKLNDTAPKYIQNIYKMIKTAKKARNSGFAVYVPAIDILEGLVDGNFEYDDYFNNSIEWLKVSDGILLVENWLNSPGALKEISIAKKHNIPIFTDINELIKHFS